jgi:flagellar biosynthesis/type III secretory pathway protein FliH
MLSLDTHQFYKRLESVGFSSNQAETITELIKETQIRAFEEIGENLATKAELKAEIQLLRSELKAEIQQVKSELEQKIAQTKIDLIKWLVTLLLAQTGIIAALVKLL